MTLTLASATCEICAWHAQAPDVEYFHENDWREDESGWTCPDCVQDHERDMHALYVSMARNPQQFGCPTCGGKRVDEHMTCHDCLVDRIDDQIAIEREMG
jgi:hypothetical protein